MAKKEEVRDGYLSDLPEDIQKKLMDIHKIIVTKVREEFNLPKYKSINKAGWAKTWLEEFLAEPTSKNSHIGSVRVYKKGKRFSCMIQITGHVSNTRNTESEELFHGMIRNVFVSIRAQIRRKFDLSITCESEHGEPFEGYDVWTKQKTAAELWDKFDDKKTKKVVEMKESHAVYIPDVDTLPYHLRNVLKEAASRVDLLGDPYVEIERIGESTNTMIYLGENVILSDDDIKFFEDFNNTDPCKSFCINNKGVMNMIMSNEYSDKLFEYVSVNAYTENKETDDNKIEPTGGSKEKINAVAKNISNKKSVTQDDLDLISNLINKSPKVYIGNDFKSVNISINKKDPNSMEFVIPKINKDFIEKFINGKETISSLFKADGEIKIKLGASVFDKMKHPDHLLVFILAAVHYYTNDVNKYIDAIQKQFMKFPTNMRKLVSDKLQNVVKTSIQLLFAFDNVNISDTSIFKLNKDDIHLITNFIASINEKYKGDKETKKEIVDDLEKMIKTFRESFEDIQFASVSKDVKNFYEGKFDNDLNKYEEEFHRDQYDVEWLRSKSGYNIDMYKEAFGVKKLKKIPRDVIAYISIEAETIKDANDKLMIASYCLSKLEIVEWYIELLDVGSNKYVVPHNKTYLVQMRTDLLACYKKIMNTPIPKADRPIINVKYPKGYEG